MICGLDMVPPCLNMPLLKLKHWCYYYIVTDLTTGWPFRMAETTLAANASPSQSWNTSTRQQNKSFLSVSLHVLSFLNNLFQHQQSRENVSNTLITSLPLLLLSKQARVCRAWIGPLPPWSLTSRGSLTLRSSAEWSPTWCCRARGWRSASCTSSCSSARPQT